MTEQHLGVATLPLQDAITMGRKVVVGGPDGPYLHGSRCLACSSQYFPAADICFSCQGTDFEAVPLDARGRLYSYTTVHVSSAKPVPYTIGYVDLESGVRILARLADDRPATLGIEVELSSDSTDDNWYFVRSDNAQRAEGTDA